MTVGLMVEGDGERRLRSNRKRFWRLVGAGVAAGAGIGVVTGGVGGYARASGEAGGAWIGWVLVPAIAVSLAVFARYTAVYFRRIDELDLQDNLWASLIGFYAFVAALPVWYVLNEVDLLPAPDVWVLWWGSMAAAAVAYIWRKVRGRF